MHMTVVPMMWNANLLYLGYIDRTIASSDTRGMKQLYLYISVLSNQCDSFLGQKGRRTE